MANTYWEHTLHIFILFQVRIAVRVQCTVIWIITLSIKTKEVNNIHHSKQKGLLIKILRISIECPKNSTLDTYQCVSCENYIPKTIIK